MFKQVGLVTLDVPALLLQELADRLAKLRIGYPVSRPGSGGQETPAQFMFALCARIEALQVLGDTVVNTPVIAAFEVQVPEILITTPHATIQMGITAEEQGGRDNLSLFPGDRGQHLLRHVLPQVLEECRGQGSGTIFALINSGIQVVNAMPLLGTDRVSGLHRDRETLIANSASLLIYIFAFT